MLTRPDDPVTPFHAASEKRFVGFHRVTVWIILGCALAMVAEMAVLFPYFLIHYGWVNVGVHGTFSDLPFVVLESLRWLIWVIVAPGLVVFWYVVFKNLGSF